MLERPEDQLAALQAAMRDWLISIHEGILVDLYCPSSESRHLALTCLAAAGWDEHEYVAVLVALQEEAQDAP